MEFPPLIGLLAFIQNLFDSQSVFVHHIFSHLASILIMIYAAKTTITLGGKWRAVFVVLLCILIAPGFGRSQQLFQPVVFSQLFWVLGFYNLTKFVKFLKIKHLWYLTLTATLGFLVKYDAVFFILPLASLLFFKRTRTFIIRNRSWRFILLFLVLIAPNLIWQYNNDFPVLKMMDRLYETQLDYVSFWDVCKNLFLAVNPINILVIVCGLVLMVQKENRRFLPLVVAIFISTILLALSNGKFYYYFPIILTIFPFGAVGIEKLLFAKRKWIFYPLMSLQLIMGILLVPFALPVDNLESYLDKIYPYEDNDLVEGAEYSIPFEERYSHHIWPDVMKKLENVIGNLPDSKQKELLIWGKHYRQAGAVNLFKENYNLPNAFSLHGSFYSWLPEGKMPDTVIALSYADADFFENYFEDVALAETIHNPYADEEEKLWQKIFICNNPKQDFGQLKHLFKDRIFE
nr:glycosyltransferase family 39 protein [Allomuricauda sp.]